MDSMSKQVQIMMLAEQRLVEQTENNMPCVDGDIRETDQWGRTVPTPSQIVYKPFYWLSGYTDAVKAWFNSVGPQARGPSDTEVLDLDFKHAKRVSWARLGHEALDSAADDELQDMYDVLEGSISFSQPFTSGVNRGFWDSVALDALPVPSSRARAQLRLPYMKSVRMLAAFDVRVSVWVPSNAVLTEKQRESWAALRAEVGLTSKDPQGGLYSMTSGLRPVTLAIVGKNIGSSTETHDGV